MNVAPVFLTVEQVLEIHHRMLGEFGGASGVRDPSLLESAVAMPPLQFDGQFLHEDVPAMAAAYLFHICKNHPLVDGNKRTALASSLIFLLLNGLRVNATDEELEYITLGVAAGSISKDEVTVFFRKSTASGRS